MYRIDRALLFSLIVVILSAVPGYGSWSPWGAPTLVTIGDQSYSSEEFKTWWQNWREKEMVLPQEPTPYIDWMLLFKEAERMKLYESPAYRKKVLTFLKARALMQLKFDEVDSRIEISDDDLWQQYLKTHAPRYQLHIFFFKNEKTAEAFADRLGQAAMSDEDFSASYGEKDNYSSHRLEWYRPLAIHAEWFKVINSLEKGQLSRPAAWKNGFIVLRLQDVIEGSRDDFKLVKKSLRQTVWKKEESKLSYALLLRLRKKYEVKINSQLLEQLDIGAADTDSADETLISTNNGEISTKIVLAKIRQVLHFRKQNGFKVEANAQFRNQVVNGIIDQTLISWEALNRKYEQKPPLEPIYKFYCQHRMIKQLEEVLFHSRISVDKDEVVSYYEKNISQFTTPELIKMVIIEGSAEQLNRLWLDVTLGGDFMTLARQLNGHDVPVRTIPANHLNPKVKEVVDTLTKDEVSQVFTVDNHQTVVRLIERTEPQVMVLTKVGKSIEQKLYTEKLDQLRRDYLEKLRNKYTVKTDDTVWQSLRKELESEDETN